MSDGINEWIAWWNMPAAAKGAQAGAATYQAGADAWDWAADRASEAGDYVQDTLDGAVTAATKPAADVMLAGLAVVGILGVAYLAGRRR